jgi:hypothetical protein
MKSGKRPPIFPDYHHNPIRDYQELIESSWKFQPEDRLSAFQIAQKLESFNKTNFHILQ